MDDVEEVRIGPGETAAETNHDRRRPRRVAYTNPDLIDLLRGTPAPAGTPQVDPSIDLSADDLIALDGDPLRAARGITTGLVLSLGCWAAIATAVWLLLSD